jgi:hypothetical protein
MWAGPSHRNRTSRTTSHDLYIGIPWYRQGILVTIHRRCKYRHACIVILSHEFCHSQLVSIKLEPTRANMTAYVWNTSTKPLAGHQ